ncbi:insulin-like growth factor-binding protein complex acid labile subunit [Lytechinus pictus]|uniref:insulin-like growth factor-binding protein complex acid labile subunit n=1 Tax=Lytechinus pictus TaxID=7653 RepID=UPI0030B9D5A1
MDFIHLFWLTCILLASAAVKGSGGADGVDANGEPCDYHVTPDGLQAICTHRNLTEVPTDIVEDIAMLDLSHNQLTRLGNASFNRLPHLRLLSLRSNEMTSIETGVFDSLPELYKITLSNNNLTCLPTDVFSHNQKLQIVDLSVNQFVNFPGNAINHVQSLTLLNMEKNSLSRLDFTGFESRNITLLNFKYNNFSSFSEDDFLPLRNAKIKQFTLKKNFLTSLPYGLFRHLEGVQEMILTNNQFRNFSLGSFLGMSSLKTLRLAGNLIAAIEPLAPLPNQTNVMPSLTLLDVQGNRISSVPSRSFWGLANLIRLDIHQSRIKTVQNDSFEGLESLEILDLTGNHLKYVNKETFLVCPRLKSLILQSNPFTGLTPAQFADLVSLESLNLARCQINKLYLQRGGWNLPNLKFLDISYNRLYRLEKYSFYGMANLTTLNISCNNQLATIENGAFVSLDHLQSLGLSGCLLSQIHSPFANLNELSILDMSYTSVELMYELFTGLNNLTRLNMRGSGIDEKSLWNSPSNPPLLSALSTLERLYLKGNQLDGLIPGTFRGLESLQHLELDNSDITVLHEDIFTNLTSLQTLTFDGNHIAELTPRHLSDLSSLYGISIRKNEIRIIATDVFTNNPHLSYLYISHNHLTTIQEGTVLPRKTLDVSNNPFTCNCEFGWFVNWLDQAQVSIIHPEQTNCSPVSPAPFKNRPILSFDPREVCGPKVWVYVITTFAIVTCLMVCIVAYQRRWLINYRLFHLKILLLGRRDGHDGRERLDYEYDINIAFDDDDEKWVRTELKPGLEERLPTFDRIVCGDDDLPLGMFYIDAITEVVEHSYKSVLIVSNRSVDNHAFINKLRLAVDHMNEVELEKIILIFKEDIPDGRLPYLIRLFLSKNKPYFRWSEDKYGQKLMWGKLMQELRYNKKMNDLLPI